MAAGYNRGILEGAAYATNLAARREETLSANLASTLQLGINQVNAAAASALRET